MNPLKNTSSSLDSSSIEDDLKQANTEYKKEVLKGADADFHKLTDLFVRMCALHHHQLSSMHFDSAQNAIKHIRGRVKTLQETYGKTSTAVKTYGVAAISIAAGLIGLTPVLGNLSASPINIFSKLAALGTANDFKEWSTAATALGQGAGQIQSIDKEHDERIRLEENHFKDEATRLRQEADEARQKAQSDADKQLKMVDDLRQQKQQARSSIATRS